MTTTSKSHTKIAIIGAGISGLAAAKTLFSNGFENITVFEAATRVGGRINTLHLDKGYIEMGAQWIHGQEDNVLYEYAQEKGLVADMVKDHGIEGTGSFCSEQGDLVNCDILDELIASLDESKVMDSSYFTDMNMYEYFKHRFDQFISGRPHISDATINLLKCAFRWFVTFEVIDNSCDNLQHISPLSYTEWEECDGLVDLINLKRGYDSVLDKLGQEFPLRKMLHLQTAVTKIQPVWIGPNDVQVKLYIAKLNQDVEKFPTQCDIVGLKEEMLFDHVIVTSSIGFLKANVDSGFFGFKFPPEKIAVIRALGFGTINKIFLYFDLPFWHQDEKGFQLLWQNVRDQHCYELKEENGTIFQSTNSKLPNWVYCIQGFDPVREQPNLLMGWIGSYGAKEMESCSNDEIGRTCGEVLRQVVPKSRQTRPIGDPTRVYVSRWHSHPYVLGSYSNRTVAYEQLKLNAVYGVDVLAKPILAKDILPEDGCSNNCPLILFAGEATDRVHYSTTDGAFRSGTREATTLINYYRKTHNTC